MSFPRYPAYKSSAVSWIGNVPAHWESWKLSHAFESIGSGTTPPSTEPQWYGGGSTPWVTTGELRENIVMETAKVVTDAALKQFTALRVHPAGSLVIAMYGATIGRLGVLGVDATTNQACCVLSKPKALTIAFTYYWLQGFKQIIIDLFSTGGGQPNISQDVVGSLRVPAPDIQEQNQITEFLDRETAKIDALAAEQEQLITLLKEKRQAIISHAVTKGLDPSVPMKDSGVEWLGEVPAHWEVVRVKHLVKSFEQGWSPQCENFPVESESDWGVLKVGCVNGGIFNPEENKALPADLTPLPELGVSAGDLLISRANTRELVGSAAVALADHHNLMLCDKLYRLRLDPDLCLPTFLSLFLGTERARGQIELAATGASSSMLNISQSTILELSVALPPVAEQQRMRQCIEQSAHQLDQLVTEAVLSIELLRERRSALISAAVTGQIDVRGTS